MNSSYPDPGISASTFSSTRKASGDLEGVVLSQPAMNIKSVGTSSVVPTQLNFMVFDPDLQAYPPYRSPSDP